MIHAWDRFAKSRDMQPGLWPLLSEPANEDGCVIPLLLTMLQHRGKLRRNHMRVFNIIAKRSGTGRPQVSNYDQTVETLNERIFIVKKRSVLVAHRSEKDYVDSFKAFETMGALPHSELESGSYVGQPGAGRGFAHDLHGITGQALTA